MLVTQTGQPIPPQETLQRLQQMDDRLGLKYLDYPEACWAITIRWLQNDPRREMVQRGLMSPADTHDILGRMPVDCPAEQAPGYIERAFVRWSGKKEDVAWLLNKLRTENDKVRKAQMDEMLELGDEMFDANAATLFRNQGKTLAKNRLPDSHGRRMDRKRAQEYIMDGGA